MFARVEKASNIGIFEQIVTHRAWSHSDHVNKMGRMKPTFTAQEQDDLRDFGERVARARKSRGWSQERLALESGLARSYLGGVERGQRNISYLNIIKIARTLECTPEVLFESEGASPSEVTHSSC